MPTTLQGQPIDQRTATLDLPLPHIDNWQEDDVPRLRMALGVIDGAYQLLESGKADKTALQALEQATTQSVQEMGQSTAEAITTALQGINQQIASLGQAIEDKQVDLGAVAGATNAAQAAAGTLALRRLRQLTADSASDGQPLALGVEYSVQADAAFARALPAAAQVGDCVVLLDPWGYWRQGLFTVTRAEAGHTINGRAEDVLFNINAWRVTITYAAPGHWALSIG